MERSEPVAPRRDGGMMAQLRSGRSLVVAAAAVIATFAGGVATSPTSGHVAASGSHRQFRQEQR